MKLFVIFFILSSTALASPLRGIGCSPTAAVAVERMIAGSVSTSKEGFRVDTIRIDRVRNQQWAMVASCTEPGLPHRAVLLPPTYAVEPQAASSRIAVRTGDAVRIVADGSDSWMTLAGTAMESGAAGEIIHVRLNLRFDANAGTNLTARVLRAGVVEVTR